MKRLINLFIFLLLMMIGLAACGQSEETEESFVEEEDSGQEEEVVEDSIDLIQVYTTLFPLEDFTKRIGGEHVVVENIIPPGADAHSFEPTANQMISIANGDLFIYNGAGYEGFADRIKETVASHDVMVITSADGIDLIGYSHDDDHEEEGHEEDDHSDDHEEESHEEDENDYGHEEDDHGHSYRDEDPHIWLDPIRAIQMAENIKDALVEIRPEGKEAFEENFHSLKEDLEALNEEFIEMKDGITKATFVVSHAGYGYWEDRYGIHQLGIAGISATNEPSIKQIQEVINFMEINDIRYVMFEQNIPTTIAETVRDEIGAEALWLHNLESITLEQKEAGEDYFSIMRENIKVLKTALK